MYTDRTFPALQCAGGFVLEKSYSRVAERPAGVEADAAGFKRFVQTGITVRVGDTLEMPLKLELGAPRNW